MISIPGKTDWPIPWLATKPAQERNLLRTGIIAKLASESMRRNRVTQRQLPKAAVAVRCAISGSLPTTEAATLVVGLAI
jgi:hypothetical protein